MSSTHRPPTQSRFLLKWIIFRTASPGFRPVPQK